MLIKKQICMTAYRQLTKSLLLQDLGSGANRCNSLVVRPLNLSKSVTRERHKRERTNDYFYCF